MTVATERRFMQMLEERYSLEHGDGTGFWPGHKGWWLDDQGPAHEQRILTSLRSMAPFIGGWRGKRCVDLGCGSGSSLIALSWLGAKAVGLEKEICGPDIELAEARAKMHDLEIDIREGDALAAPFETASFDVVVSHQVAEHVRPIARYFEESYRILKPGGFFILVTDNRLYWKELHTGLPFIHWLPWVAFRSLVNLRHHRALSTDIGIYQRSCFTYRRLARRVGFHQQADRVDLFLAKRGEASDRKRRLARITKLLRLPLPAVMPGTSFIFRKPARPEASDPADARRGF